MRTVEQHDNELVFDKKVYVGIDVHKENWHFTIRTLGEEVFNGRIPGSYISLKKVLDRYRGNSVKVAYKAGPFMIASLNTSRGYTREALRVPRLVRSTYFKTFLVFSPIVQKCSLCRSMGDSVFKMDCKSFATEASLLTPILFF